jgi:hypothetical protein
MDDPWDAPAFAPPVVCMGGGMFRLAERWLVAAGGDVAVNLAALQDAGMPCDCLTVQLDAAWPGPELRPVMGDWNPFDRPRKKNKKGQKQKAKR